MIPFPLLMSEISNYKKLIERNLHARLAQFGEDVFVDGIAGSVESLGVDPYLDVKGDGAVVKGRNADDGLLVPVDVAAIFERREDGLFDDQNIGAVGNADVEIKTAHGFGCVVDNHVGGDDGVGNDKALVVGSGERGKHQLDAPHRAGLPVDFDEVAYLKGAVKENQHAAGKVGKAVLQRQRDGNAGRAECRHKGGHVHAECGKRGDDDNNLDDDFDAGIQKRAHALVHFGAFHAAGKNIRDDTGQPPAEHKDQQCAYHSGQQRDKPFP